MLQINSSRPNFNGEYTMHSKHVKVLNIGILQTVYRFFVFSAQVM